MERAADGAGVPTGEGDAVGTTVGCGVLARFVVLGAGLVVLGAGLVDVTRAVGLGVAVAGDVEGTTVDEPAGRVAEEPVVPDGLRYT